MAAGSILVTPRSVASRVVEWLCLHQKVVQRIATAEPIGELAPLRREEESKHRSDREGGMRVSLVVIARERRKQKGGKEKGSKEKRRGK
jgi:hypothetical protein